MTGADPAADPWGALVAGPFEPVDGAADGPLTGTRFVAKDLFDVAGTVTGAGQPTWAATHPPATAHAPAVARLLAAGATLVGKAHTAEMAYSLSGANAHHGMPVNPHHPDLDPAGSSSGSAAAVAGGLADLALGTDTLGSIRVPASACGVFGWRPTHGLVPAEGVHPLAPSLDTVGLLARDPTLLHRAAEALAATPLVAHPPGRLLVARDAWAPFGSDGGEAVGAAVAALGGDPPGPVDLAPEDHDLDDLVLVVRDVQGPEFADAHRDWIEDHRPTFGPGVAERVAHALAVTPAAHRRATLVRQRLRDHLATLIGPGDVVLVPAGPPPAHRDADEAARAAFRAAAARCSVVGSLAGLPTVVVPGPATDRRRQGVGLLGAAGADGLLLRLAAAHPPVPPATGQGSP